MKMIASAALAGAALLLAAVPASADDGPLDFGILQGVNDSSGSHSSDSNPAWRQSGSTETDTVPQSALARLVDHLVTPPGK
ncbi:hypothetical protein ACHBTE_28525 [Streptomyces sp. M41]|uniref:hypothetical protein n=1 Tax=Streptomyces sp. M41 TaxID=3059412 RepID=UPI00374D8EAC